MVRGSFGDWKICRIPFLLLCFLGYMEARLNSVQQFAPAACAKVGSVVDFNEGRKMIQKYIDGLVRCAIRVANRVQFGA